MKTLRQQLAEANAEVARLKKMTRCRRAPIVGWLGGIIQQRREHRGWTLHFLADKAQIAAGLLSRIESNPSANPTLNNLLKLSEALECPLSELVAAWELETANKLQQPPPQPSLPTP